ncbi:MAG: endonuclease/exonuclease/phosphatase family protein [Planctomycetota bacterium]
MRWFTPGLTLTGSIGVVIALITGQISLPSLDDIRGTEPPVYDDPIAATLPRSEQIAGRPPLAEVAPVALATASRSRTTRKSDRHIKIATFNIQTFGKSKAEKPDVMDTLARIFMIFDVVAVQELKGDPSIPINSLFERLHRLGARYDAIVSDPLGRSSQTERYAFVWDTTRVQLVRESAYLVADSADRMHRQPYVATFQARVNPIDSRRPFSFSLINVHTDPDEVKGDSPRNELNVLDDVFIRVRQWEYDRSGQEDFFLLGDLNVDSKNLQQLGQIPNLVSVVGDQVTAPKSGKTYDHILMDRVVTQEWTGQASVLDVSQYLTNGRLTVSDVSDHLPVWAEFDIYEIPPSGY